MNFEKVPEPRRSASAARNRFIRWTVFGVLVVLAATVYLMNRSARATESRAAQRVQVAELHAQVSAAQEALAEAKRVEAPLDVRIARTEAVLVAQRKLASASSNLNSFVAEMRRVEIELDGLQLQKKVQQSAEKETLAAAAEAKGDVAGATELYREAWQLQREINRTAGLGVRDIERERRLEQGVNRGTAEPMQKEMEEKLAAARRAVAEKHWDQATPLYKEARALQERLNREFPRSRFSDLTIISQIDSELSSLSADGLNSSVGDMIEQAHQLLKDKKFADAAKVLGEAADAQRNLNENFSRSRFVSMERLEQIETERQTAIASEALSSVASLRDQLQGHLRRREIFQAQQAIREALQKIEDVTARAPKARGLDESLRLQLGFLNVRSADLSALQDRFYEQLVALPGKPGAALLKTEVIQSDYVRIMSSNPSRNAGRTLPVDSITFADAEEFCRRLSWVLGWNVRLPTAAELTAAAADTSGAFENATGGLDEWVASDVTGNNAGAIGANGAVQPAPRVERSRQRGFRFVVEVNLSSPTGS